jgi:hypothetical protein
MKLRYMPGACSIAPYAVLGQADAVVHDRIDIDASAVAS